MAGSELSLLSVYHTCVMALRLDMRAPYFVATLLVAAVATVAAVAASARAPSNTNIKQLICQTPGSETCLTWPLSTEDLERAKEINYISPELHSCCGFSEQALDSLPQLIQIQSLGLSELKRHILCKYDRTLNKLNWAAVHNEILNRLHRVRRQVSYTPRGRYRGQTQSQYLSINHDKDGDEGKAEAHSAADGSRAIVSGSSGMGQAQSQSVFDTCDNCNIGVTAHQQHSDNHGSKVPLNLGLDEGRLLGTGVPKAYGSHVRNTLGSSNINGGGSTDSRSPPDQSGGGSTEYIPQKGVQPSIPSNGGDISSWPGSRNSDRTTNNFPRWGYPDQRYDPGGGGRTENNRFGPNDPMGPGSLHGPAVRPGAGGSWNSASDPASLGKSYSNPVPTNEGWRRVPGQESLDFGHNPGNGNLNNANGSPNRNAESGVTLTRPMQPGMITTGPDGQTYVCCVVHPYQYGIGGNNVPQVPYDQNGGSKQYGPDRNDKYGPSNQGGHSPGGQVYVSPGGQQYGPGTQGQRPVGQGYAPDQQYGNGGLFKPGGQGPINPGGQYGTDEKSSFGPGGHYGSDGQGPHGPQEKYGSENEGKYGPGGQDQYRPGGQGQYGQYGPGVQGQYGPDAQRQYGPGQQRQYGPDGQGQYGPGGQGQYGPSGPGQYGPGGQGQYGPNGPGQYGPEGQGQYRPNGQEQYRPDGQTQYKPGDKGQYGPGGQRQYGPNGEEQHAPGGLGQHGQNGKGQLGPGGQGQYGPNGQGQYGPNGQGQYGPGGQGQYVPNGQGQHGTGGQGQYVPNGQGQHGTGGQGQYVPNGQGQHGTGGQGQYGPNGQGQHGPGGQGQYGPNGQEQHGTGGQGQYGPNGQGQQGSGVQEQYGPNGQGQHGPNGEGKHGTDGQGQYGPNGQGQHGTGTQGQYGPGGEGQYGPGGSGQYGPNGQGQQGPGGQEQYGPNGQGKQVPGGQGQYGPNGEEQHVPNGMGQYGPNGQEQYGQNGKGQQGPGGQGQYGPNGQGQQGPGGQGQYGPNGEDLHVPSGQYGPNSQGQYGPGGQGQYGQNGKGQQGPGVQGQYGPNGQGQQGPGGQGQYGPDGQGQYGPVGTQVGLTQFGPGGPQYRPGTEGGVVPNNQGQFGSGNQGQYGPGGHGETIPNGQSRPGQDNFGANGQGKFGTGGQGSAAPGGHDQSWSGGDGRQTTNGINGPKGQGEFGSGGSDTHRPPGEQGLYGPQDGNQNKYGHNGDHREIPQNVIDPSLEPSLDDDSEAQAVITQDTNGTVASASSKGGSDKGRAQTQVEGKYTGSGSFSAQAQISDENKGAESQVNGGKHGATSSAQGRGRSNKSQANVELGSETGSLITHAQSDGTMHNSNSQVQGSVKGGMADAQAHGPGSTSSQAQIGFTPYKEGDKTHETFNSPFVGGGTASAQSSGRTGQTQSQLQGTFKYGITYNGAAQAGASIDKDAVFPNRLPFNKIDVFDEANKNINVNTENTDIDEVTVTNVVTEADNKDDDMPISETNVEHSHLDHHKTGTQPPLYDRRSFQHKHKIGNGNEYTTGKEDNPVDEYDTDGAFGPAEQEVDQGEVEYPSYDEYNRDSDLTHQSIQKANRKGLDVKQSHGGNTQHIVLGSLRDQDAVITQRSSEQRPDETRVYQPGEQVPGTGGYTIPIGFTGSVKSVSSKRKTYAIGSKDSPSQAQSVSLSPGTGKVKYVYSKPEPKNVHPKDLKSLLSSKHEDNNRYMSVSKSVTGALDSDNNVKKQYSHTYYTKSSSCGYFTFTCTIVSGTNGKKKVCRPKIPTNPDGTPMNC